MQKENGYSVYMDEAITYVDNKKRHRSGHMTHAMCEFQEGKFIDFNSSCSAVRAGGHTPYGYVEYRIGSDYGRSYFGTKILPFSYDTLMDALFTVSVEKAVACRDGSILAFCLRNTMVDEWCCEPWLTPYAVRSTDGGETWELCEPCFLDRGIRNPQTAVIDGVYVCHGRGAQSLGAKGFVFYTSLDGKSREPAITPIIFCLPKGVKASY
ncbi:MAG: hypothetical protein Q4B31_04825 [Clostridia bacterium]|nr:hypothetical protein [Clostridia bacterium]